MTITYAITVCNEHRELEHLLQTIRPALLPDSQLLIQYDEPNVTAEVMDIINYYTPPDGVEYTHYGVPLNDDFGTFKNHIFDNAKCEWIFQIDADEFPSMLLVHELSAILDANNDNVDVILVPRVNTVDGLTLEFKNKWKWNVIPVYNDEWFRTAKYRTEMTNDEIDLLIAHNLIIGFGEDVIEYWKPVVNFPDYQWRLYKNTSEIRWVNKVHERLQGFNEYATLPAELEYCLYHPKALTRQINQNERYSAMQ